MSDFSDLPGTAIPIIAILMPIGIIAVVGHFKNKEREMIHRERMAALEKGLQPPADPGRRLLAPGTWLAQLPPARIDLAVRGPRRPRFHVPVPCVLGGASAAWTPVAVPLPFLAFIPAGVGLAFLVYYAIEASNPRPPTP